MNRTAQIYLELHFCVELRTKKALVSYQETTLGGPKLTGVWAREVAKNLGPLLISLTLEASCFKFGTELGFGE